MNTAQQATRSAGKDCKSIKDSLLCPHCGQRMKKWAAPNDPFSQWDTEFLYICFNDACPYFVKGWEAMRKQGRPGISYRLMYDPEAEACRAIPVASNDALRGWIVE